MNQLTVQIDCTITLDDSVSEEVAIGTVGCLEALGVSDTRFNDELDVLEITVRAASVDMVLQIVKLITSRSIAKFQIGRSSLTPRHFGH